MKHPYTGFAHTRLWQAVDDALSELERNQDLALTTAREYVIGWICQHLAARQVVAPSSVGVESAERSPESMQFTTVPLDQCPLGWRFSDPRYDVLPPSDLAEIKPLAPEDARRLWASMVKANVHHDIPVASGLFPRIASTHVGEVGGSGVENQRVRAWLRKRGVALRQRVWLSYQPDVAIETVWGVFIEHWYTFYYPASDDLTVVDGSMNWVLLFSHEEEVFFGSREEQA